MSWIQWKSRDITTTLPQFSRSKFIRTWNLLDIIHLGPTGIFENRTFFAHSSLKNSSPSKSGAITTLYGLVSFPTPNNKSCYDQICHGTWNESNYNQSDKVRVHDERCWMDLVPKKVQLKTPGSRGFTSGEKVVLDILLHSLLRVQRRRFPWEMCRFRSSTDHPLTREHSRAFAKTEGAGRTENFSWHFKDGIMLMM